MNAEILARLKEAAGPGGYSEDPSLIAPHLEEWRSKYKGSSPLMLRPDSTARISKILAICHETTTPLVPQGGNTGLVGGQIPFNGEVLISLQRLNRIRSIDVENRSMAVDAGVVLTTAQQVADENALLFPLSLAAEGSATIGGNLSTNAGGVSVVRYGMMRDLVLGLEVVLADGRILNLMKALRKDNTGYDLKQIFIGAEGTLGIITAAVLKLFPKPDVRTTVFAAVPSPDAAVRLLSEMQTGTGGQISAFELIPRTGLELVIRHIAGTRDPLSKPSPWYVLAEATSAAQFDLDAAIERSLVSASAKGLINDAVIANSESQRSSLWALRETMSEAQKRDGASIKHDVSVPVSAIPEFVERATAAVLEAVPGARAVSFGHIGDGNIHFNFSAPIDADGAAFLARWEEIQRIVHDIVHEFGGSISAEHGIGVQKRDQLVRYKTAVEMELMRTLKRALDPKNILNPGKVVAI
jgi:FAD/FMN-containing dehydrogenase